MGGVGGEELIAVAECVKSAARAVGVVGDSLMGACGERLLALERVAVGFEKGGCGGAVDIHLVGSYKHLCAGHFV